MTGLLYHWRIMTAFLSPVYCDQVNFLSLIRFDWFDLHLTHWTCYLYFGCVTDLIYFNYIYQVSFVVSF